MRPDLGHIWFVRVVEIGEIVNYFEDFECEEKPKLEQYKSDVNYFIATINNIVY